MKKPENIGFDIKGVVKLFDFGLAKELHLEDQSKNGNYKLTVATGSLRYMAPEVANKYPYNLSADVYSFGLILWETASLKPAFDNYNQAMFKEMVQTLGYRPDIDASWPDELQRLIKTSWDATFKRRPSFVNIILNLDKIISNFDVG